MHPEPHTHTTRLHTLRLTAGYTFAQVGERLGMSMETYCDIECIPDEVYQCVTMKDLAAICHLYGVSLRWLFQDIIPPCSTPPFGRSDVQQAPRTYLASRNAAEFDEWIDWGCSWFINNISEIDDWFVDTFIQACEVLELDWRAFDFDMR